MPYDRQLPDWRDAREYQFLYRAERSVFAWEWLRRMPDYRAAGFENSAKHSHSPHYISEQPQAGRWGLHAFESPCLPGGTARPIWRSDWHPFVLRVWAESCEDDQDAFDFHRVGRMARVAAGEGVERLLLSDGYRSIRLDVRGASLLSGPVRLSYELTGIQVAKPALVVLRRFLAFSSESTFSRSLHPSDRKARRQILLLRTYDGLRAGADQRKLAAELLSRGALEKSWRIKSASLRSQVQRLVQGARAMAAGRFWDLLM